MAGGALVTAVVGTAIGAGAAEVVPNRDGSSPAAVTTPTDDSSRRGADDPTGGPTEDRTGQPTPDRTAGPSGAPTAATSVGQQRAVEIALARTGGGQVVKVEKEQEHGRLVWSVRIAKDGTRIRVDVDAATGQVVRDERDSVADV
ncbi:PepSY domain-containing protein, partial [Micromonospora sp. NPDC049301]|uniref:PepSY domain-containing protein n=1 Tax=Micromonospora sp. NPDC049301 TaxID=3155723 RepID=UPI00341F48DA